MTDFMATTVIRFTDGTTEGQVLHVGTKESCQAMATMLNAVHYEGPKTPEQTSIMVLERDPNEPIEPGQFWVINSSQKGQPQ